MSNKKTLLGTYLKERRVALSLSQLELARLLGYDNTRFVSRWERGLELPPEEKFDDISRVYEISPEEWHEILQEELGLEHE